MFDFGGWGTMRDCAVTTVKRGKQSNSKQKTQNSRQLFLVKQGYNLAEKITKEYQPLPHTS